MRWLAALLLALSQAVLPATPLHAQSSSDCDSLSSQIESTHQDLDQLKNDSLGWLSQLGQFGAIAPSDLTVAAANDTLPGLDPATAGTFGALAATIGAEADVWRSFNMGTDSGQYWQALASPLSRWDGLFATLLPFQGLPSLTGLWAALNELDQMAGKAGADQGLIDSLQQALDQCQASQDASPPPSMPAGPADQQALCSVGGTAGYSNSDCFRMELDVAFAEWKACTEAHFEAVRQAFAGNGDFPPDTCDAPYNQATEELQKKWGGGG